MQIDTLIPPFISEIEKSYLHTLKERFKSYKEYLTNSEFDAILNNDDYDDISDICDKVILSLKTYLTGRSGEAYKIIDELLNLHSNCFEHFTYILNSENALIRIRRSQTNLHYRKELFHIPFNQRHKVCKQRYSIEGLPCLYLAACSYTAWLELNRPNFNELWASAFRVLDEIPMLDLGFTIPVLSEKLRNNVCYDEVRSKLKLYPLIISTSFRTKYPFDTFHEEYIISGILLQWIMNNSQFKGIRYLSTKLEAYTSEHLWYTANYVFPPQNTENDCYCEYLRNTLKLTLPQHWSILTAYSNAGGVTALEIGHSPMAEKSKDILREERLSSTIDEFIFNNYNVTRFYNVDGYLRWMFKYNFIE